ncbi:bifunctional folylpolyglutamate synthase/dihydrofolate synthase [Sutcliffiella horikoshii]|uniref:bifunctional folylpolyglutamate synthase/dihydrofolate synthase n=1 Tax=Sutcliffiella horikoshii TaxID=79883 RepID=UPI001CBF21D6|nr:folylpolyglutamate synthase/dihydrofolate synthase family protein [Sutcliffiella horikoshii]UAL46351.1 bifunctional folylpolyglutamate synthase/dihydrofolate synthase [Sutcliffiella horikoshii]
MFLSFKDLQERVNFTIKNEINLGLDRILQFLEKVGNPQNQLQIVHIGGTNGKGSTLRFLESVLRESGLAVGVFHSPAYRFINDQLSVNGTYITDEEMVEIIHVFTNHGLEEAGLTEFELQTAMAFYYFATIKKVDITLIEVGLGGREDSTNIMTPALSIITNVGHDHIGFLGSSVEEIAHHKAGIIKRGVPVISGEQKLAAKDVIQKEAFMKESPVYFMEEEFSYQMEDGKLSFRSAKKNMEELELSLQGEHQTANASLAIMAYLLLTDKWGMEFDERVLKAGLMKAEHPGRFELIQKEPPIILDGAHNEEAVDALVNTIKMSFSNKRVVVLFSALKDKPIEMMVRKLETIADEIIFTSFNFPRAARAEDVFQVCELQKKEFEENWKTALQTAISRIDDNSVLLITGSLYFISDIRTILT